MKSCIIHLRKSEAKSKAKQGSDQKVGRTAHKASAEIIFPRDRGMNDLETGILKMALVKNTSVRVDPRRMKIIKKTLKGMYQCSFRTATIIFSAKLICKRKFD